MKTILRLTILVTFLLIILGGFVHNSGNSLACPDWPLCYGQLMPPMVGGVLIEHGHRTLGALVGLLVILNLIFLPKAFKRWGWILLAMVIFQGMLGGITVLFKLPTLVSTFHLSLSLIFFSTLIYVDHRLFFPTGSKLKIKTPWHLYFRQSLLIALALCATQIVLGAFIRHAGIGSACGLGDESLFLCRISTQNEWVSTLWPSNIMAQWHMAHRILGILCAIVVLWVGYMCIWKIRETYIRVFGFVISSLVLIQVGVGIFVIHSFIGEITTTIHLMLAALLLAGLWKYQLIFWSIENHCIEKKLIGPYNRLTDIWDMTKPKLTLLVMVTSCVGVLLTPRIDQSPFALGIFIATMVGIYGLVAGSCTINCVMEKTVDARMERTRLRPIPTNRVSQSFALSMGIFFIITGTSILAWKTNMITVALGLGAVIIYLLAYTPLKVITPKAVYVGAIPGAIPPVMGLTSMGTNSPMAFFLFALLFLWQIPHFLALSLFYQEDYNNAQIKVFPTTHGVGHTMLLIILFAFSLLGIGYMPSAIHQSNELYPYVAGILGIAMVIFAFYGLRFTRQQGPLRQWARSYFYGTILYLPILLGFLILFKL